MVRYVQAPSGKNCGLAGDHFTVLSLLATTALFSYMSEGEPSRIPSEVKQKRLSFLRQLCLFCINILCINFAVVNFCCS